MALVSLMESLDLIIMTIGVGFIFMDTFKAPLKKDYDPVQHYTKPSRKLNWQGYAHNLWFAVLITAPAVIFHELAHKFTALAMGLHATFHAAYLWLGIGVLLKIIGSGFVFFVPGYVQTLGASPLQHSLIAFAGPGLNLLLFLTAFLVLKTGKKLSEKSYILWNLTKRINGFLFIFNMIPLPFFDGGHVFKGLATLF